MNKPTRSSTEHRPSPTHFIYRQKTGALLLADKPSAVLGTCYSGRGEGLNNPRYEDVVSVGPLPCGDYMIGAPQEPQTHLGPLAFPLTPLPSTDMHGRSDFFIHGDNVHLNHSASDGCIIAGHELRMLIERSVPCKLTVVPGEKPFSDKASGGPSQ